MIFLKLLKLYLILITIRAVLSWFQPDPTAPLMRLLVWLTDPVLSSVRRMVPPITLPGTKTQIDLSPVIIVLVGGWLISKIRF